PSALYLLPARTTSCRASRLYSIESYALISPSCWPRGCASCSTATLISLLKYDKYITAIRTLMFKALMPQRREFFDMLAAHSDRVVAGANAALRLIQALGTDDTDIDRLVKEVAHNEKSADQIKIDLITLLHKSFTTPINRDQIHSLTNDLDRVLHSLRHVANAIEMYNIDDSTS